jgi:chaperonin GroEL (HSP60 family)
MHFSRPFATISNVNFRLQIVPRMLAENSGTKSAASVLTELSAAHKEDNGKTVGYNIDAEQSLGTDLVSRDPNISIDV